MPGAPEHAEHLIKRLITKLQDNYKIIYIDNYLNVVEYNPNILVKKGLNTIIKYLIKKVLPLLDS
ncbi:unnamed protein product [Clonostachys rhizophaga]|uniref:Uncharacterized protein n=1 Tax=Clonostachys rhizophaga TaxID=160324 RepID=A0A9N9VYS5_9HYPO|nr:unnamed protein product [Clonostachys rhizophaga]